MRTSARLALLACASLVALAFAGPAWSVYKPALFVTAVTGSPGKPAPYILGVGQDDTDDPTAKITIYSSRDTAENLTQAVGTTIGDVDATVIVRDLGAKIDVTGTVKVDTPANYTANQCAPGLHGAVWLAEVTINNVPFRIPFYVDDVTAGPEAAFASVKIQVCFAGPVGTPNHTQLLSAFLTLRSVFTNPPAGTHMWRATFTPYFPNTPNPNAAGTVETQAFVPNPVIVRLTVKRAKRGVFILTGKVTAAGGAFRGVEVGIYVGQKKVGAVKTNSKGVFTFRKKVKKKTTFQALAVFVGDRAGGCVPPPLVPAGCVNATTSFVGVSNTATARPKRRR